MIDPHITSGYQEILESRFPGVLVTVDPDIGGREDGILAVFGIPDDQRADYLEFMIEKLWPILEERGLPRKLVMMHTVSVTEEYYPSFYKQLVNRRS